MRQISTGGSGRVEGGHKVGGARHEAAICVKNLIPGSLNRHDTHIFHFKVSRYIKNLLGKNTTTPQNNHLVRLYQRQINQLSVFFASMGVMPTVTASVILMQHFTVSVCKIN